METWVKRDNPAVQIEAIRLNEDNAAYIALWSKGELVKEIDPIDGEEMPGINIETRDGTARASISMYVGKYAGGFFVMHTRPFEDMYKPLGRPAPPPESIGDTRIRLGFGDQPGTGPVRI
jgi:hypothetical protein